MREIKFRFWGNFGELNYKEDICEMEMLYGDRFCFFESEPINDLFACRNFQVMQFTGLTDKNGKECYQGDILINPKKEVGLVVQYEGGFALECKRKNNTVIYIILTSGFMLNKEIIGNLYESPELIK
jgi:hypothetical protein